jgi:hypothetical protein
MKIEKIITLANNKFRLRFLAMERSLRAVGCDLPLLVIPYDETRFDLPANAKWWPMPEISDWLTHSKAHPAMRKYQCLTVANFQYVDSDICFLRNPAKVLESSNGFITSCGHWHNSGHTYTQDSLAMFSRQSTTWQKSVFNSGQWACDRALFSIAELKKQAEKADFRATCLSLPYIDQAAINMLVFSTGVPIHNLTLPPFNMQSTWAGDYLDSNYRSYWKTEAETPYLIHWAGTAMWVPRPINNLFLEYLTVDERKEWDVLVEIQRRRWLAQQRSWRARARRVRDALRLLAKPS